MGRKPFGADLTPRNPQKPRPVAGLFASKARRGAERPPRRPTRPPGPPIPEKGLTAVWGLYRRPTGALPSRTMSLSSNPEARARQLANLRPIWKDKERFRAHLARAGFGAPGSPVCKTEGCRTVAIHGTGRCRRHGGRFKRGSRHPEADAARAELRGVAIPRDLAATDAWREGEALPGKSRPIRLAALLAAWRTGEDNGDWAAWRNLTRKT